MTDHPVPIMLRPSEESGGVELCRSCGQTLPRSSEYLTDRELDVLTAWWLSGTVREAAHAAGVGEQRAKNLLAAGRNRNHASNNMQLLAMYLADVRDAVLRRIEHNSRGKEAQ